MPKLTNQQPIMTSFSLPDLDLLFFQNTLLYNVLYLSLLYSVYRHTLEELLRHPSEVN